MLDGLVNEVVAAFGSRLPRSVALETVSSIGLWPVFVDSEQIMRALDALVANAVEAVDGQGRVYVEALNVRAGRETMQDLPGLKSGDYRSEERRVGEECVSTGRSRWSTAH